MLKVNFEKNNFAKFSFGTRHSKNTVGAIANCKSYTIGQTLGCSTFLKILKINLKLKIGDIFMTKMHLSKMGILSSTCHVFRQDTHFKTILFYF